MVTERPFMRGVRIFLTGFLFGVLATVLGQVYIAHLQHTNTNEQQSSTLSYQEKVRMLLVLHEGRRSNVYTDTRGIETIGVGHNLREHASTADIARLRQSGASDAQIELWLTEDISRAEQELERCFGDEAWFHSLSDNRRAVLTDMCFNLGLTRFLQFERMIGALRSGNFEIASREMLNSRWARQVGERARRLSRIMRSNNFEYPSNLEV